MAFMGALAVFSLLRIDPAHIDHAAARGLAVSGPGHTAGKAEKLRLLFTDRPLLAVGATLFFFHLGNAALLPLLGQSAVAHFAVNAAAYTAGTVILAQATMILAALWGARVARTRGYGTLFLIGPAGAAPARVHRRAVGKSVEHHPVQVLDGVGAGLLGVGHAGTRGPAAAGAATSVWGWASC